MNPGDTFDTPFESGCVFVRKEEGDNFLARDSDGVECIYSAVMVTPKVGDRVRVVHPTGGVRKDDVFVVVPTPEGQSDDFLWVVYDGPPDGIHRWKRFDKDAPAPWGFVRESLKVAL